MRKSILVTLGVVDVIDFVGTLYQWFSQSSIFGLEPYEVTGIGIGLFMLITLVIVFVFVFGNKKKLKQEQVPITPSDSQKIIFYPKRTGLEVVEDFVKRHNTVNAVFASGQLLGALSIYQRWGCFKKLILLNPHGKHLKEYATRYYDKTENELKRNILLTKDNAISHVSSLIYRDDCLPFSMMIGDSETRIKKGEILLELHIPHTEADERPTIIFKEEDYPDLFVVLKKAYDYMLKEGEKIK